MTNVGLQAAGRYGCTAGNVGQLTRADALLCVKDPNTNATYCGKHLGSQTTSENELENGIPKERGGLTTHAVAIACGAAAGYILLVILLLIYCKCRRNNKGYVPAKTNDDAGNFFFFKYCKICFKRDFRWDGGGKSFL